MNITRVFAATLATALVFNAFAASSTSPVLRAAGDIGISPEALVVSDLADDAVSTEAVLDNLDQAEQLRATLNAAKTQLDQAGAAITPLASALQVSPNDQSLQSQYDQAIAALDTARQSLDTAIADLRDVALGEMSGTQQQRLANWDAAATRNVPAAFRVVSRTDAEWSAIELALRAEKRANRLGEQLATEHAQVLAAIRADFDVIEAQLRLDTDLAAVKTAFEQYGSE